MNRVLFERPQVEGDAHVHGTPLWLLTTLRLVLVVGGLGTILFVFMSPDSQFKQRGHTHDAITSPLLLVFGLAVALGFYGKIWRRQAKFIADGRAVYFPCNELLVAPRDRSPSSAWLEVPWQHISNLRRTTKTTPTDQGDCVAFDVQVSPEEREKFFRRVSRPDDNRNRHGAVLSVAYNDFPPSVAAILRKLLALSRKGCARAA